jgi:Sulfotransferase family
MPEDRAKVLYIAGCERSGSTILQNVLGQTEGFFAAGELRNIWLRLLGNKLCGCGVALRDCEVWRSILEEGFGGVDRVDAQEMARLRKIARNRHLPLILWPTGKRVLMSRLEKYLATLETLYRAIQSSTGSRVIVDSSKSPLYGEVLRLLPSIDLYVVHIVRDPRGVEHSRLRRKKSGHSNYADHNLVRGSLVWDISNLTEEMFRWRFPERRMTIRYEDFVQGPKEQVNRVLRLLGEDVPQLPFVHERLVSLDATHTVGGSPSRRRTGEIELRLDEEWKATMEQRDKVAVTALTWPLLLRYGYPSTRNIGSWFGASLGDLKS